MKEIINQKSGGTAAQTTLTNSNPAPENGADIIDDPMTLKQLSERFGCAASSLKSNIKSDKLSAVQDDPKAPYMVKPSLVEAFLRETPGINSIFHPRNQEKVTRELPLENPPPDTTPPSSTSKTAKISVTEKATTTPTVLSPPPEDKQAAPLIDKPIKPDSPSTAAHLESTSASGLETSVAPSISDHGTRSPRKRRRGKGRGKRTTSSGNSVAPAPYQRLKALEGTSPGERLRITACLTELANLVASQ